MKEEGKAELGKDGRTKIVLDELNVFWNLVSDKFIKIKSCPKLLK